MNFIEIRANVARDTIAAKAKYEALSKVLDYFLEPDQIENLTDNKIDPPPAVTGDGDTAVFPKAPPPITKPESKPRKSAPVRSDRAQLMKRCIEAARRCPETFSVPQFVEQMGGQAIQAERAVYRLASRGLLERVGNGLYKVSQKWTEYFQPA